MQGKGIIKFFLVVMLIVTAVQYLYIIPTSSKEAEAEDFAQEQSGETEGEMYRAQRAYFLDSISDQEILKVPGFKSFTYQDLKAKQLNLGLDLKGGMSVVLQVDLKEFLFALSRKNKDDITLNKAIDQASQAQANAQDDFIALFATEWQKVRGDKKLASLFSSNDALREDININSSDAEVVRVLREKANETVQLTYDLLKKRIDQLGVVQPNVSLDADRDLILVELPGIENPARARTFLQAAANLEFFHVKRVDNAAINALVTLDQQLDRKAKIEAGRDSNYVEEKTVRYDTIYALDDLGNLTNEIASIDTTEEVQQTAGPLFSIFSPNTGNLGESVLGIAAEKDLEAVSELLESPEVARQFRDVVFRWEESPLPGAEGEAATDLYALYQLQMPRSGEALLTGEAITNTSSGPQPDGQIAVNLSMNSEGARTWARMTTEAANDNNRQVAILLDGRVVSAPRVNGPIPGGNTAITGNFNVQDATDLANILKVGRLPARTQIIQESIVGPSLGAANINSSIMALLIGFGLVLVFMLFYYGGAGIVSILALLLNLIFIFGALSSFGTVLTLPGIAGILLTIGMAVDANVIIYERIREELRAGKTERNAVTDGFSNSYSAIIDANVTTLLIAAVLAYFGLGPIKGFAVVLMVGVVSSVFTAVLVGRLIIEWWLDKGKSISFWTAPSQNLFSNVNIDWMGKRKLTYAISGVLIIASLASIFTKGFDLGVDFKGGYSYVVEFDQDVNSQDLRDALATPFGSEPTIKAVDSDNTFNIVTDYLVDQTGQIDGKEAQDVVLEALYTGVNSVVGGNLTLDAFGDLGADSGTHVTSVSKVGPTIADDIKRSAFWAGGIGLLLIFLYLLLRFNKWQYSLGAVAALFHDSIIVLGMFSFGWGLFGFNMEMDQAFIAAVLTVIGYSINDTVVVYDRIREYLNTYVSRGKTEVINAAVSSTVSRTIITSLTTMIVVLVLFLFGGSSIKGFAFALLVGILVGTYSSIFIATPIVHDLTDDLEAKSTTDVEKASPVKA
ncbi:protein translocase subunit SecDF [Neolewinella aurantiaca]|uniref:Multifunctional fusion protein n=1 Tax=Neolewinella aurantiaca TaxID=2602767 RepID=A0A5C7FWS3_9BACT|nr:protein translocase subunit SecDF [Neolewinella aurantiaca]TXF91154.1 protein translocase subunit SecDF [Neolewinella aurantiaca]